MARYFDGIHMEFLSHLTRMGSSSSHHVCTNDLVDLVTEENLQRLRGLKIMWLSGGDNAVYSPKSTAESYAVFREMFPDGAYERVVVPGYGHLDCWMGKASVRDVYPRVRGHVEACEPAVAFDEGYCSPGFENGGIDGYVRAGR
jgi:hypothetical protein